ncbi:rCG49004, isoform CRA_a [Rattus norvegicus]|uniref:RCG49004, isoform CRA_a n=1 Tax=Rattus norvegicus TaxID=10116 RepID=A6IG50_RAT|nr:rCG49004, isoform CRA_a [Rattus norvegicus]
MSSDFWVVMCWYQGDSPSLYTSQWSKTRPDTEEKESR